MSNQRPLVRAAVSAVTLSALAVGALLGAGPATAAGPAAAAAAAVSTVPAAVYTTTYALHLRAGAGSSNRSLKVLPKGAAVTVNAVDGGWSRVSGSYGTGWVSSAYLKKAAPAVKDVAAAKHTTAYAVHLRSGPDSAHRSLKVVPKGATVTVTGISGSWSRVSGGHGAGWISSQYLRKQAAGTAAAAAGPAAKPAAAAAAALTVAQVKALVRSTAESMKVDPALALALAEQESGFRASVVSSGGALGVMQVMPANQAWASQLAGRKLDLAKPADNITAGVAILRQLLKTSDSTDLALGSYFQGQYGVQKYGMYPSTRKYVEQVKARMAKYQ